MSAILLGRSVWEARTNRALWSEDYSNAYYLKSSNPVTVTANQAVAPNGAMTMDLVTADANGGVSSRHGIFGRFSASSASAHSISRFIRKGTHRYLIVGEQGDAAWHTAVIDTDTWTVVNQFNATAHITPVGNDVYRVDLRFTRTNSTGNIDHGVWFGDGPTNTTPPSFVAAGTETFFAWGEQVEIAASASPYIKTEGSTATRAADTATITDLSAIGFNASEGTIVAEVITPTYKTFNNIVMFDDGTTSNRLYMYLANQTSYGGFAQVGGTGTGALAPSTTVSVGQRVKLAMAYKLNDFAMSVNGGSVATDTSSGVPTVNRLSIGTGGVLTGRPFNEAIKSLIYYPTRKTNSELQALSAL